MTSHLSGVGTSLRAAVTVPSTGIQQHLPTRRNQSPCQGLERLWPPAPPLETGGFFGTSCPSLGLVFNHFFPIQRILK